MKLFGHPLEHTVASKPIELSEITFQAPPDRLRLVAAFLGRAADEMEKRGSRFGHCHIQDEVVGWGEAPDLIVSN
jgi:hypothetical protein